MLKSLLFLLLPAIGFGQQMRAEHYRDFSGGLFDSIDGTKMDKKFSPELLNVVIDEPIGTIKPRNGFTHCGVLPSGSTPKNLFQYAKSDGSRRLIATDGANFYQTADCTAWTRFQNGLDSARTPNFKVVRDLLWTVNGSTHPFTWDGSTTTILDGRANTPSPSPAKCEYIEFWRERVWCARDSSNPSGIYYSALFDSAGNALNPSTGTTSWPAANIIQVDQDAGSPIYGIKAYRDNLYAFKDNGIWRIEFRSDFEISVIKTLASVGSRFNSSIVEIDGLLRFVGPDGVYVFDGEQSKRVSDRYSNLFLSLNQPLVNELFKTWTAQSDFDDGTMLAISTDQISGSIEIEDVFYDDFLDGDFTTGVPWTAGGANAGLLLVTGNEVQWRSGNCSGTCTKNSTLTSPLKVPGTFYASVRIDDADLGSGTEAAFYFHFIATGTSFGTSGTEGYYVLADIYNQELGLYKNTGGGSATAVRLSSSAAFQSGAISNVTLSVYRAGDGTIQVSTNGFNTVPVSATNLVYTTSTYVMAHWAADTSVGLDYATIDFDDFEYHRATGSWISDKFNAVTVSSWSTFDVNQVTNGGSLSWQYRAATSEGNLDTTAWSAVVPGSVLNTAVTNIWVQFQSSFTMPTNLYLSPRVDDVTINYVQGGSQSQTIFGSSWENRYWVSASSGANSNNNLVMVSSKHDVESVVPYDLKIGPMVKWNDNFYAGASTHSAVYRLDNGTNDNGRAIPWYWNSRDEIWELPYNRKRLQEIIVDFRKGSANSVDIGYQRNDQTSFTSRSVDMSGSGLGTKRLFFDGGYGQSFRFRVSDNTLDQTAEINGLGVYGRPLELRE